MNIYVFGNVDVPEDNLAFIVADKLRGAIPQIKFVKVKPNEDLPFIGKKRVVILDAIEGIEKITELKNADLDKLVLSKSLTVHDFDLGFQLKYLKKIGKLGKVTIIGLPMRKKNRLFPDPVYFKKIGGTGHAWVVSPDNFFRRQVLDRLRLY